MDELYEPLKSSVKTMVRGWILYALFLMVVVGCVLISVFAAPFVLGIKK